MNRVIWILMVFVLLSLVVTPMAASANQQATGTGVIRDDKKLSDKITITLSALAPTPAGKVYQAWLSAADGSAAQSLGVLQVAPNGAANLSFSSPAQDNLVTKYATLSISLEPAPGPSARPSSEVVVAHAIPAAALTHIRHLLSAWTPAPDQKGLSTGEREQARLLAQHAKLALDAATAGNMTAARQHSEHVINITEGSKGPNYGDRDGNGQTQNPGDGFGLLEYAKVAAQHAGFAATAAPDDKVIGLHSKHVIDSSTNVVQWATAARDQALKIAASTTQADAVTVLTEASANADKALNGFDANRDGAIAPIPGEGGALTAYEHSQNMAWFTLAVPAVQVKTGDETLSATFRLVTIGAATLFIVGAYLWLRSRRASRGA